MKNILGNEKGMSIVGQGRKIILFMLPSLIAAVIVHTHMPQIATYAANHFSVSKKEAKGKTRVFVKKLEKDERVKEIARMMGGEKITSVVSRHAEELINEGGYI